MTIDTNRKANASMAPLVLQQACLKVSGYRICLGRGGGSNLIESSSSLLKTLEFCMWGACPSSWLSSSSLSIILSYYYDQQWNKQDKSSVEWSISPYLFWNLILHCEVEWFTGYMHLTFKAVYGLKRGIADGERRVKYKCFVWWLVSDLEPGVVLHIYFRFAVPAFECIAILVNLSTCFKEWTCSEYDLPS